MGANLGQAEGGLMAVKERSVAELQPKNQRKEAKAGNLWPQKNAKKRKKERGIEAANFCQRQS